LWETWIYEVPESDCSIAAACYEFRKVLLVLSVLDRL